MTFARPVPPTRTTLLIETAVRQLTAQGIGVGFGHATPTTRRPACRAPGAGPRLRAGSGHTVRGPAVAL
ncbi:hypothetical protein AB0M32_16990 [Streptomyces sp. NPDC051985]|uniref:hypothetical protein n=1 Tax=Streptomyces sp. NPDC051985 TaxID=3155807 RepID=UPI00341CF652